MTSKRFGLLVVGLACAALVVVVLLGRGASRSGEIGAGELRSPAQEVPPTTEMAAAEGVDSGRPARQAIPRASEEAAEEAPISLPGAAASLEDAELVVTVVDHETGGPVPGVRVLASTETRRGPWSHAEGREGGLDDAPLSDAAGTVLLRLPALEPVQLSLRGEVQGVGTGQASVAALQPGERRAVAVPVVVGDDLRFFGRVLASESGEPIADAHVAFQTGTIMSSGGGRIRHVFQTHRETTTDADGRFEALLPSWLGLRGRVDAEGYGSEPFEVRGGHEHPDRALSIAMQEEGALVGDLLGPSEGVSIEVELPGWSWGWSTQPSSTGGWRIAGLPAGQLLSVQLLRGERMLRQETVVLEPGEERSLDWRLGSGATLRGLLVLGGANTPLVGTEVWLLHEEQAFGLRYLEYFRDHTASARTDQEGRFTFEDVGAGVWLVGPAPEREPDPGALVPLVEPLEVLPGISVIDVHIVAHRGVFLSGRVETPRGNPLKEPLVDVTSEAGSVLGFGEEDGTFTVGPLAPGMVEVRAHGTIEGASGSDSLRVPADSNGIVLRLKAAGSLSGVVVDPRGIACPAVDVRLASASHENWGVATTDADGRFRFGSLLPGTYDVLVRSGELVGHSGSVLVQADHEVSDVVVSLFPGARLTIDHREGGEFAVVELELVVAGGWRDFELVRMGVQECFLPPGELTVTVHGWRDEERVWIGEERLRLVAGGDNVLIWPPSAR